MPFGDRTRGDLIEEYYWDLAIKKDELEERWKSDGGHEVAKQLNRVTQLLKGSAVHAGKSGDEWFDDWDGDEDEDPPPKGKPVDIDDIEADDWKDVAYEH